MDKEHYLPCNRLIKMLVENLDEEERCTYQEIIIHLYSISSKELKARISKAIRKILDNINDFNYKYFKLYYEAVMNKVVESNSDYETRIIKYIDEVILKRETERKRGTYTLSVYGDPIEYHLGLIANLLLNNLIINPQLFDKYKGNVNKFDFLYNIDEFDFDNFDIMWLKHFSNSLHQTVFKNKKAKKIIKEKL